MANLDAIMDEVAEMAAKVDALSKRADALSKRAGALSKRADAIRKKPYDTSSAEGQKRLMYESVGMEYIPNKIDFKKTGDYGADPVGDGTFRMVPSGDIVDYAERNRRLKR